MASTSDWESGEPHAGEDELGLVDAALGDEPAGALGDAEEEEKEEEGGEDGDAEVEAPLQQAGGGAGVEEDVGDDGV